MSEYSIAGLGRRFAAMIYDALLLLGIIFVVAALYVLLYALLFSAHGEFTIPAASVLQMTLFPLELLVVVGFYLGFWVHAGKTLGMQSWRLRLVSESGEKVSYKQALVRLIVACCSLLSFGVGYWVLWFSKERLTWHDRYSKTRVIVEQKLRG